MIGCLHYPAAGPAEILLIMLPGAGINALDFTANGMVSAVQEYGNIEVIVAQPDLGLYLDDGVTEVLHREVVGPALARGAKRIWLLGISLGGMGALLYASAHQQNIEGVFLIAPFLGTRGTTAELAKAGGLANWRAADSVATAPEQRLLTWLQADRKTPEIYLGYALQDRFAPVHKLLAARLPPQRVVSLPGGHDWPSWSALWRQLLDAKSFSSHAGRCAAR
jgi:hypothetical protein